MQTGCMEKQASAETAEALLRGATPIQIRWVLERLKCKSDRDAARKVGVSESAMFHWPNKAQLDDAVKALLMDGVEQARLVLRNACGDAAETLVRFLATKQGVEAAKAILDRAGLPAVSKQEHSGPGGQPLFDLDGWLRVRRARLERIEGLEDTECAAQDT